MFVCLCRVNCLAWDSAGQTLFLGGVFDMIEDSPTSSGLAVWTAEDGLREFPAGGLTQSSLGTSGFATDVIFEPRSQSLFVSGEFQEVGGYSCFNLAVWHRGKNSWMCLHQMSKALSPVTTLMLDNHILFASGWATATSDWLASGGTFPYAVSMLDISEYIRERDTDAPVHVPDDDWEKTNTTNSTNTPINPTDGNNSNTTIIISTNTSSDTTSANSTLHRHRRRHRRNLQSKLRTHDSRREHRQLLPDFPFSNVTRPPVRPSGAPVSTPAPSSTVHKRWVPEWVWLPGFVGGNGPILRLSRGQNTFSDRLFMVGAFNNFPSVVMWSPGKSAEESITTLPSTQSLHGLVTTINQVRLKHSDPLRPYPDSDSQKDYTFFILISCVLVGVFLGVTVTFGCRFSGYTKIPTSDLENQDEGGVPRGGIPLKTLSGDGLNTSGVDFKECFVKAMKARHLPTHESLLVINPKEIVLSRIIGEGSFGRVWSGQWRNSSVAVKEFVFAQAAIVGGSIERNRLIEEIVGEAGIMACLRHPKILQLYGCSLTMQAIWIVSELCMRGSLRAILSDEKVKLSLVRKLSICLDVADGMMYLHTRNPPIIHRDLKSQNIFITEPSPNHFVAKIGDWGSARAVALSGAKSMTHGVGTACWLAPEVINYAHFSKDSDVYAFGIVLWEIFSRQEVYEGYSAAQIISKVAHEGLRPRIPPGSLCGPLMAECWSQDASDRPGFPRILKVLSNIYATAKTRVKNRMSQKSTGEGSEGEEEEDEVDESDLLDGSEAIQSISIENLRTHNSKNSDEQVLLQHSHFQKLKQYFSLDSSTFFNTFNKYYQFDQGSSLPQESLPKNSFEEGFADERTHMLAKSDDERVGRNLSPFSRYRALSPTDNLGPFVGMGGGEDGPPQEQYLMIHPKPLTRANSEPDKHKAHHLMFGPSTALSRETTPLLERDRVTQGTYWRPGKSPSRQKSPQPASTSTTPPYRTAQSSHLGQSVSAKTYKEASSPHRLPTTKPPMSKSPISKSSDSKAQDVGVATGLGPMSYMPLKGAGPDPDSKTPLYGLIAPARDQSEFAHVPVSTQAVSSDILPPEMKRDDSMQKSKRKAAKNKTNSGSYVKDFS